MNTNQQTLRQNMIKKSCDDQWLIIELIGLIILIIGFGVLYGAYQISIAYIFIVIGLILLVVGAVMEFVTKKIENTIKVKGNKYNAQKPEKKKQEKRGPSKLKVAAVQE
ncbi:Hypothetical_protein [Hexamita inflata]|uniref:Hypothetical_protein n=1 Tax=Hexamita inflata TaxID=28002 RepID=A0AA86Q866_9EUKA|nr:Hypothetical protein HINF_LOCUS11757 [Hexamita inflata]CAI9953093.1 Hypothetical protein HINF_LOCUS40738 [Hexamita inflata]